jgi:type III pantothenate kinase
MNTSLCLDFGNTICKCAVFTNDSLVNSYFFKEEEAYKEISLLIEKYQPTRAILSSVIIHNNNIDILLNTLPHFILLTSKTPLPFTNNYKTPTTLGNDRLALVAGVQGMYPNQKNLIICLGTCLTYNYIDDNNIFQGGAISPGINLRIKSMHDYTDKLPLIEKNGHLGLIGQDTETSLRSGAILGILAEIHGTIELYEKTVGKINAVLTGGDISYFETMIKNKIFANRNVLFNGLYAILNYNTNNFL